MTDNTYEGRKIGAESRLAAADFEALVRESVPLVGSQGVRVKAMASGTASLLLPFREDFLRPGGTVTGPALFGLADVALYGAVLSVIGRVELAVTTSMTINFLRRPPPAAIVAEARILKLGKRLAYGEVLLSVEGGEDGPVAHATGTYSIPPDRPGR